MCATATTCFITSAWRRVRHEDGIISHEDKSPKKSVYEWRNYERQMGQMHPGVQKTKNKNPSLSLPHDSPCVSQICGVMQRAPPSRVSLVDVSSVLEQELAGD